MNEYPKSRGEDRLDKAISAIQEMPVPQSPGARALVAALPTPAADPNHSVSPSHSMRSYFMRRVIPLSAMAAGMLLAVWSLTLNSTASSALAQVIEAATKHKVVRCRFQTSAEIKAKLRADGEEEFVDASSDEVVYFDLALPRIRVERREKTINDAVQSDWVTVQDNREDRLLVTSSIQVIGDDENTKALVGEHVGKTARLFRVTYDDQSFVPFTQVKSDKTLLEILREMQSSKAVLATKEQLDGREVSKYRLDEPKRTVIVWVDQDSKLPVRIEQELLEPRPNVRRVTWTYTNFEWDADAAKRDELFSTTPPPGYRVEDHTRDR
jgi:hypothetical protein